MIYQDPLAYLLGLEGIALLDAWAGDHDRAFTDARLAEIRRLLDDENLRGRGVTARASAPSPPTSSSRPAMTPMRAAACSPPTSRSSPSTSAAGSPAWPWTPPAGPAVSPSSWPRGHHVIGVDSSPDMLAHARRRVPGGEFRLAPLDQLPLPDDSVDVIVCALALVHVPRLQPVLAEFARVLRPGGDLVISDIHHELVTRGSVIKARGPAGEPCIAATYRHQLGDYLRAALSLGFQVRRCEEPSATGTGDPLPVPSTEIGDWQYWPWSLMEYLPEAARAAGDHPRLVIWHFQLPAS